MRTSVASPTGHVEASASADYRAGLLAGLLAGTAIAPIMMAMTTFLMDLGPWAGPKMAWSLVEGKEIIRPGFEVVPILGGTAVSLAMSGAFGLAFAWLFSVARLGYAFLGALYGFGLYLVNIVVVPKVFPGWAGHMFPPDVTTHAWSAGEHVFFGVVLGLAYKAWRRD
jgi:hypothetical protein